MLAKEKNMSASEFYALSPEDQEICLRQIVYAALPVFGISEDSDLKLLGHRENAVYCVKDTNGIRFALRVHRHDYHSEAGIRSELDWMQALDSAGVHCPGALTSKNGKTVEWVSVEEVPEPRLVDVFEWVEGSPPAEENLMDTYETLGEISAKIHTHGVTWEKPEGFERLAWDEDGLLGENPLWGRFVELEKLTPEQRDLLIRARDKARQTVLEFGKSGENYGLIHADLMPENIMVTDDGGVQVIDFDDSGFGWHMYDLATAVFFHCPEPHFEELVGGWVTGYRKHRSLPDGHLALLPTFLIARALICLGWAHTRRETETAKALTGDVIALTCHLAEEYLSEVLGY